MATPPRRSSSNWRGEQQPASIRGYSALSARTGLTLLALLAGIHAARRATAPSTTGTTTNTVGSLAFIPYSSPPKSCADRAESTILPRILF